jgi:ketosteroid isomerase-like protein
MADRSIPAAISTFIESTNSADTDAFVSAFAADATLVDWGRTFIGHDRIRAWNQTDNIGVQAHFELVGITAGTEPGTWTVTLKVSGNGYNGTGPMHFRIRGGLISELRISG